jgi:hypothetical protein
MIFARRQDCWRGRTARLALAGAVTGAVIYQHRTAERDRFIAAAMSQIIEAELANSESPSGTQQACEQHDDS